MKKKNTLLIGAAFVLIAVLLGTGCRPAYHPNILFDDDDDGDTVSLVYTTSTADGREVELIITTLSSSSRAAIALPNGSTYVLKIGGVVVSRGTVVTGADGIATFTSVTGKVFTAELGDDAVAILDTVITDTGETVTLPEFGHKNDNYHYELPFVLSSDSNELRINLYRRNDYLPTDPGCDNWVLQNDENKGIFPIGKWVNDDNSGEFILFTATTLTTVSPWFDTYRYDYSINGTNLVLSSSYRVPYIPTIEEQEYIDNFHSKYETTLRAARPWIPATSTFNLKAAKQKQELDGRQLGIALNIVDHPDMTFVNDADVIGTWTVVDFINDYTSYNPPSSPHGGGRLFWAGLKFDANGILHQKYDDDTDWQTWGRWTRGLLQTDVRAPKYEIKTYGTDRYIFVQWKSGDYTIRGQKPSYYVFKKVNG